MNSPSLLERTGLTLYNINESTLVGWYKNTSRVQEVRTLLQGLDLPSVEACTAESLPQPEFQPTEPQEPPISPHVFPEVEDTSGEARTRQRTAPKVAPQTAADTPAVVQHPAVAGPSTPSVGTEIEVTTAQVSRTTEWRRKKKGKAIESRKTYTCRVCSQPMSSAGHTQFRGQRYCPYAPGKIPKEEWLAQRKEAAKAKSSKN